MKVCVLQPDYAGTDIDYANWDPQRNLSALLPDDEVVHLQLRKASVHRQLRQASLQGFDIFVNLCEGYLDWEIPSIDVIWTLDRLGLPHTGSPARLYDPSKSLMKYVAHVQGVATPAFREMADRRVPDVSGLAFPLFVKPGHAGDSLGVDDESLVADLDALDRKCLRLFDEFGSVMIEEYVDGREFTVLVAADPDDRERPLVLRPLEFVFGERTAFKTYDLKITQHHPESNVPVSDPVLDERLREAARRIFVGFAGEGYARLDFRMAADGTLHFLDINFACSVFYAPGSEGSADYILRHDGLGQDGFLRHIIREGVRRHRASRRLWKRRGNASAGYGIAATRDIAPGEVVFRGEENFLRLVTRSHLERTWTPEEREVARHYAIPLSSEVLAIWDTDPENWAPQNHSCDANTAYRGLDVVALRDIPAGQELTLDYSRLCDGSIPPFACGCGAASCRGTVAGTPGFSLTAVLEAERARSRG